MKIKLIQARSIQSVDGAACRTQTQLQRTKDEGEREESKRPMNYVYVSRTLFMSELMASKPNGSMWPRAPIHTNRLEMCACLFMWLREHNSNGTDNCLSRLLRRALYAVLHESRNERARRRQLLHTAKSLARLCAQVCLCVCLFVFVCVRANVFGYACACVLFTRTRPSVTAFARNFAYKKCNKNTNHNSMWMCVCWIGVLAANFSSCVNCTSHGKTACFILGWKSLKPLDFVLNLDNDGLHTFDAIRFTLVSYFILFSNFFSIGALCRSNWNTFRTFRQAATAAVPDVKWKTRNPLR